MLEKTASVLAIIRDAALLCAVALMLIMPQTMAKLLLSRGFNKVDMVFGEVDLKSIGSNMSEATFAIEDAASVATDGPAREKLQQALKNLNAANDTVKAQLSAEAPASPAPAPALAVPQGVAPAAGHFGWVFAGKVDETKTDWLSGGRKAVSGSYPPGPRVTIAEASYLHADSGTSNHAAASVVGAIKAGQSFDVAGLDWSHALGGGWFVWLKVPLAGS